MKKILAIFLTVVLLFSVGAFSSSAEGETTAKVTIITNEGSAVDKGTTTYFTVRFDNFSAIKGIDVTITADQNIKLGDVITSGFPNDASKDNNYIEENEGTKHTIRFVDLTAGKDGKITFEAVVPEDATTTGDPSITVKGEYAKSGKDLFVVEAPAAGTFELTKEIPVSAEQQTAENEKVNVDINNTKFVPQGAVYIKNSNNTYTFAEKQSDGTFKATDAGNYVYQSYDVPENGITTFGASDDPEDNTKLRFGSYSNLNANAETHGTLVFEGDWLALKNYYIQNGYTVEQFVKALYEDVTAKLAANKNATYVYYTLGEKEINVYRFVQKNYMWKSGNVLEYAIRLSGILSETTYAGIAFSIANDDSKTVTISKDVKSVTTEKF